MNTQHTPGPWEIKLSQDDEGTLCDIGVPDKIARCGQHVCSIHGWGFDYKADKEQQANARLIAAAPDLLASLDASTIALQDFQREAGMQTHPKLNWQIVENLNLINKAKGIAS